MHSGEFGSLFLFTTPTGCNRIPNWVLQPFVLIWIRWTGWPLPESDIGGHTKLIAAIVWQNPCEYLAVMGQSCQAVGWFVAEKRTLKEAIPME